MKIIEKMFKDPKYIQEQLDLIADEVAFDIDLMPMMTPLRPGRYPWLDQIAREYMKLLIDLGEEAQ